MPQRLTLDQLTDLKNDPRMQNPQVRAQVYAKVDPIDRAWLEQQVASDTAPDYTKLPQQLAGQAVDYATENPRKTGAMIGGVVAPALVTGGASLPVSLLASFLGGAGGAGLGMTADATHQYFGGTPSQETLPSSPLDTAKLMGQEGATQAAMDFTGRSVGAGLKLAGNGLMNSAIGSQAKIRSEFPGVDLADTLNSNGINPFTKGGVTKAGVLRKASGAETRRLADAAGQQGGVIRRSSVESALTGSRQMAAEDAMAGMPGGDAQISREVDRLFGPQFPYGDIPANQAPGVTRSLQRRGRAARAASNAGDLPKGLDASINDELASGVRQTANDVIGPDYQASNAKTQSLIAAGKIAKRGSRQGLSLPSLKASAIEGLVGGGGYAAGHPVMGALAGAVPMALSVPQISAPTAITLYRAGKLPYALLLKVLGPEVAQAAGITDPGGQ